MLLGKSAKGRLPEEAAVKSIDKSSVTGSLLALQLIGLSSPLLPDDILRWRIAGKPIRYFLTF